MSEELPQYNLIRCANCNYYFGKHKNSKNNCPRCGVIQKNLEIIKRTNDAEQLHHLVSINNLPTQLRKDFNKKNNDVHEQNNLELKDVVPFILNNSVDLDGIITLENIKKSLNKNNTKFDVLKLVEIAEYEGLLIRLSNEKWRLIG
ncbi:MAG: hypothetical protein CMB64_07560 [Euryarchaeota archaeon]|nr:hypothetical protein [Euryarchaeota archaeon]|tara:strand:+ start:2482 stop:2919 length:438 start_codon:yes stop_codon:yes gene_type:complete